MVIASIADRVAGAAQALHGSAVRHRVRFLATARRGRLIFPQSISWRIFKNPVSLFVGGVAAVIPDSVV